SRLVHRRPHGVEIDIAEDHVQCGHEGSVCEEGRTDPLPEGEGDCEVHAVEARHAVGLRKFSVDGLHAHDQLVDRSDGRPRQGGHAGDATGALERAAASRGERRRRQMWLSWHAAIVLCVIVAVLASWLRGLDGKRAAICYAFARETAIILALYTLWQVAGTLS